MVLDIFIPENVRAVIHSLENAGFEAYIVGGCVRDSFMGRIPNDYDVCTNAKPDEVKAALSGFKTIDTGIKHGTVTVISDNEPVEVTTYRIDGEYSDHRKPDSVEFTDQLTDDLSRRDFTINAMAYSDKTGVVDVFNGQKHLFNRKIRCVGEPEKRFEEDALRILRALRFASELEFVLDKDTDSAVHRCRKLLRDVSEERITAELNRLLMGENVYDVLMNYHDVIEVFIPEIAPCVGFNQQSRYHLYDVWEHTAMSVSQAKKDLTIRLAMLLHDISKPDCFKLDDNGQGHFYEHEQLGAEVAEKILRRLKYPNSVIEDVVTLIRYHYVTPVDDERVIKRLMSKIGSPAFHRLMEVQKADSRAKQPFCMERVPLIDKINFKAYEIEKRGDCISLKDLAVNGNDIMELGYSGKAVGVVLEELLQSVISEEISNDKDALISMAKKLGEKAEI